MNIIKLVIELCTVLFRAGWAPVKVRRPPSFKCLEATADAKVEDQTLCFHIRSEFLMKSAEAAFPPI